MIISPLNRLSPLGKAGGVGGAFSIANSFLLDGSNEDFGVTPITGIKTVISGTTAKFTIHTLVNITSLASTQQLFNAGAYPTWGYVQLNTDGSIAWRVFNAAGSLGTLTSTAGDVTTGWHLITLVYDYTDSTKYGKIYVDAVETTTTGNLKSDIRTTFTVFHIASNNGSQPLTGYQSQFSINNLADTAAGITAFYKGGKPLNPEAYYGANNLFTFNPDDSGATAQFSIVNQGITALSRNLESADKTTTTPY